MTDLLRRLARGPFAAVIVFGFAGPAAAQQPTAPATLAPPARPAPPPVQLMPVVIGYLGIEGDERHEPLRVFERFVLKLREAPFTGAQVSIEDAKPLQRAARAEFSLERITVKSAADLGAAAKKAMTEKNIHFFLLDAPATAFRQLAADVKGSDMLLFNVTAEDDSLRRDVCAAEFVHVIPSLAQTTDALVQFAVWRKWRNILMLEGPAPADVAFAQAFTRSAKKFGATIVADQKFVPGGDPRLRDQNNPALLTSINRDWDVTFVADSAFDFARTVSYRTVRPRPVMGSIDLEAAGWHWTWDHNGAPQTNARFLKLSNGRRMESQDFAAYFAVKMIVQSVLRSKSTEFPAVRTYMLGPNSFDGDKGLALSVRPWDHQVRQAILLAAPFEVVDSAPLEGFLHQTNELDTLGDDRPESPCHLDR